MSICLINGELEEDHAVVASVGVEKEEEDNVSNH